MTEPKRVRGDDGVTLLIVLVFMMLVSVLALTLLSHAQTNFETTNAVQESRQSNYATDGATELAISNVINDPSGDLGTPYGPDCEFTLTGINGRSSKVTCEPYNGAGAYNSNHSINALLTLSSSDALILSGTSDVTIDGRVYSNAGIDVDNASNSVFTSDWTITAEGDVDCTNIDRVVGKKGKACNAASTPAGDDPGWAPRTTTRPSNALAPVAACPTKANGNVDTTAQNHLATFTPGTYTSSPAALAAALNCNNQAVLYFTPGVYYFEDVTFDLLKHRVVAGTAQGNWLLQPQNTPNDGTACKAATSTEPGAQFIFGGTTSMRANSASDEPVLTICGPLRSSDAPSIAVFGLKSALGGMKARASGIDGLVFGNKPSIFVRGTVYMPSSSLKLTLHNRSRTYYNGGVIAYAIEAALSASKTQEGSPISLPPCSAPEPCRSDRHVVFTAYVNGSGTALLRSLVKFDDQGGAVPATSTDLEEWSTQP